MVPQRRLTFESLFTLFAPRLLLVLLWLLFLLLLLLLLVTPLPRFMYLVATKMICEGHLICEIALTVAASELCGRRWSHHCGGGV